MRMNLNLPAITKYVEAGIFSAGRLLLFGETSPIQNVFDPSRHSVCVVWRFGASVSEIFTVGSEIYTDHQQRAFFSRELLR